MATKKGPITKATADAAGKADELLAKGTDAYGDVREGATAKYDAAKDAATVQYDAAKQKVTDTACAAKAKVAETHKNARAFVKENPEKSVGVAVGVGALLGAVIVLALTRRR